MAFILDPISTTITKILSIITSAFAGILATLVQPFAVAWNAVISFFSSISASICHVFHAVCHFFHTIASSLHDIVVAFISTTSAAISVIGSVLYGVALALVVTVLIIITLTSITTIVLTLSSLIHLLSQWLYIVSYAAFSRLRHYRSPQDSMPEIERLLPDRHGRINSTARHELRH